MKAKTSDNHHSAFDRDERAENIAADLIGFRTHPQRGQYLAVSVVRSQYHDDALLYASISNGELTRERLAYLSINDVMVAIEFLAFCSSYLASRMFMPMVGETPGLSRLLLADNTPIADDLRKESLSRAREYIPALSDIHDNRAAPRDSRLVQKLLAGYLDVLIEDPRQATLDTLLSGFGNEDIQHGNSGFSARQIAEALDRARLWATLGWRRGQAERRFRLEQRGTFLENFSGDVRVMFEPDTPFARFSDIRRLRHVDVSTIRNKAHPCDDAFIANWIAGNCAAARQAMGRAG